MCVCIYMHVYTLYMIGTLYRSTQFNVGKLYVYLSTYRYILVANLGLTPTYWHEHQEIVTQTTAWHSKQDERVQAGSESTSRWETQDAEGIKAVSNEGRAKSVQADLVTDTRTLKRANISQKPPKLLIPWSLGEIHGEAPPPRPIPAPGQIFLFELSWCQSTRLNSSGIKFQLFLLT